MKKFLFFISLLVLNLSLLAQITVQGTVKSATDGTELPGVSVLLKGTTTGTVTDLQGHYSLSVPKTGILVFSYIGFQSKEVPINNQKVINVKLKPANVNLNELVVIGYGVQKKKLVTGAISSIGGKDIKGTAITQAAQALQYAPGVQVISNSGSPGSPIRVRIRGFSSNNNSSPIYIVDGVRTSINNLNPNDIKSIQVLKDAASSAIYGAEGGNGVVIITTKKGQAGKSKISYDFQYSWQSLRKKMDLLNTSEYATYMKEADRIPDVDQTYNTDWQNALFTVAPMQKHHLAFSGGNQKTNYYLSLSYLDQDGIVYGPHDYYKRLNLTETSDHHIKKWLKVGNTIMYSKIKHGAINEASGEFGGVVSDALMMDPATPVEYTNTIPSFVQDLINSGKKLVKSPDGNYYGISQYVRQEIMNPFVKLAITNGEYKENDFLGMVYMEVSPIKGLKFTSRASLNLTFGDWHSWSPTYYYSSTNNNGMTIVSTSADKWQSWMWDNFASYKRRIGSHSFNIVLGTSARDDTHYFLGAQGGPMTMELPSFARLNYISTQENDQVNGSFDEQKLLSYFGRINYSFKNKYLFEASFRRDGAGLSQLPKDGRWGNFPAVSGGWVISNENFFPKKEKGISFLKLRASWGKNGSLSNLGGYSYASFIRSTYWGITMRYPLTDSHFVTVYEPSQLPNPDLKWEKSIQTDIGLDLHALNDHLTFTFDYYRKVTSGLITQNTPPFEAGNNAAPINAGDVLNRGFEFDLGYHNRSRNGNFKYNLNVNLSTLHNEVTYLNPQLHRLYGAQVGTGWTATVFSKGYPVWYFYGYKTDGINKETGDPNFVDVNGDGVINSSDKTYIGSPIPKILYGGNFNVSYKQLSLSVIFEGAAGNKVLMGWIRPDVPTMNMPTCFYTDRWTPENPNGTMPKAGADPKTWNSDILVFDASYLSIQQIQLGYNLPPQLLKKMRFSSFRVYISLNDFFMITSYPGLTPQVGTNNGENNNYGIDHGTYPMSRSVMIGTSFSL
ncbi:TonB-dependent receptor [Candidatus Sulfidibacterium hydrothermale]|uniref:SusC/RagA family TonB-linked outer membrane protein n=1 Tax=Candidatus Sulfidibacterium hydrothermale TaxID=2875962 RepID=UPI001F0AF26A|nr:TonB-dependent receptor [Candidatus Sulfidibacterium hydrothermale]UBM62517.1 TonB-dependent receptor [Candidatus Sulfidibacterium hydrothermale]